MSNSLGTRTFYGILDTCYVSNESWTCKYDELVKGGAGIIQLRAKDRTESERYRLTERIIEHRTRSTTIQPPLITNVDIELALSYPELGLHLGQNTISPEEARERLGPDRILGLSALSPEQVHAALNLDPGVINYFSIGPVFASQTKPSAVPVGLKFVEYVAKQKPKLPFYCIGGINCSNLPHIIAAGGKRIISVSDVLRSKDTAGAVQKSIKLLHQ